MRLTMFAAVMSTALVLAGCSVQEPSADEQVTALPAPGGVENPAPEPVLAPAPATLAGEWRVAGIDDEPLDAGYGLALSADESEIWWKHAAHV